MEDSRLGRGPVIERRIKVGTCGGNGGGVFMEKPSSHLVWEELWGRIPSDKPVKRLGNIMVCGPSQKKLALGALLRGGGITMAQKVDWMVSGLGLGSGLG